MKVIHPRIRKLLAYTLKKFNPKAVKTAILVTTIFIIVDCLISIYATNLFTIRMIANNDLNVKNKEIIISLNDKINNSSFRKKLINTVFSDKIMVVTYPNLKIQQLDGSMVYFKDLLPDIQPYYYRFQDRDFYK